MPHLTIEYSANLADVASIPELLGAVHRTACESGVFEIPAIRTRAVGRELALVGDGNPANGFVLIIVRMKSGRPVAVQEQLAQSLLDAASRCLAAAFERRSVILNVEIHDIPSLNLRRRSSTQ
ncbi:MAG TPA: 5-carboxymethyl-2-hydroxymuconate Delta-isomerase [Aliidongia sp.]|uniref:5-carboxymethyl-2-hydroxymuconate Delta-isomerase n=1 Tax=Aliidongia sp. TaxID=1914230 RepID=UPI002DDCBC21|nr:5-carboxymethyl-2-hydroxymuconate Delta-isomerase [Aliidongia sp.]HEV2674828.1 5-carboxymethyl-2-hydroxymuconate Delta-isomerase [Aliidongia sp.]